MQCQEGKIHMQKNHLLNLIKVLAVLMIINSHSDVLFPENLRLLATGGALGNGVFFILSGYFTSTKNYNWRKVLIRFCRLYIPVYTALVLDIFLNNYYLAGIYNFHSFFKVFIWPTPYWFVSASFVSYLLLEIIKRYINKKNCFIWLTLISAIYAVCYIWGLPNKHTFIIEEGSIFGWNIQFKCIYGFLLYVIGFFIKKYNLSIQKLKAVSLTIASFILFCVIKIFIQKGLFPMHFQFVTQLCVISFSIGVLISGIEYEYQYRKCNRKILNLFDSISRVSLEAYVFQMLFIPIFASKAHVAFPVNYIMSSVLIILFSFVLYYIDSFVLWIITSAIEGNNDNDAMRKQLSL